MHRRNGLWPRSDLIMNGFYSLWTAPTMLGHPGEQYVMQDYEILMLMLSVSSFERHNGPVSMYADDAAASFLESEKIDDIFSRGIKILKVPEDIDPKVYWAAGKLYALKAENLPSVMIDTDLIIWKDLSRTLEDTEIAVIHREELNPAIYPDPFSFEMKDGYAFPKNADFSVKPANTAMLYIKDPVFRDHYCEEALKFMRMSMPTEDTLNHMVFAEQRLLAVCAAEKNKTIFSFCEDPMNLREQKTFTHFWGHKNLYKFNAGERTSGCRRMLSRLRNEYPSMYEKAVNIDSIRAYL